MAMDILNRPSRSSDASYGTHPVIQGGQAWRHHTGAAIAVRGRRPERDMGRNRYDPLGGCSSRPYSDPADAVRSGREANLICRSGCRIPQSRQGCSAANCRRGARRCRRWQSSIVERAPLVGAIARAATKTPALTSRSRRAGIARLVPPLAMAAQIWLALAAAAVALFSQSALMRSGVIDCEARAPARRCSPMSYQLM